MLEALNEPEGVRAGGVAATADSFVSSRTPEQPWTEGDAARLREMFRLHYDLIWRSLRRLGVPASAVDDAAQQVFWVAARKLDEIEIGRERAFLFGTVLRIASDARRARARAREVHDEVALRTQASPDLDPEAVASAMQTRRVLDAVLDAMPIGLRTVFVLFEIEGLSMAEIARLLDAPEGTVASRLRRARKEFHAVAKRFRSRAPFAGGEP